MTDDQAFRRYRRQFGELLYTLRHRGRACTTNRSDRAKPRSESYSLYGGIFLQTLDVHHVFVPLCFGRRDCLPL
jgi:hypothetical protein